MRMKDSVLIVIDVQNDFCSDRGLFKKKGANVSYIQKMVLRLKKLIGSFRKLGIPVVFVKAIYDKKFLTENIRERYEKAGLNGLCQSGTWGADFYKVEPKSGEKVFIKHRYDAFTNPQLEKWLKKKGMKTIVLTGCTTDVCVDSAARSGFMKGFNIVAVKDCLATPNPADHKRALEFMKKYYNALVMTSKELLGMMK